MLRGSRGRGGRAGRPPRHCPSAQPRGLPARIDSQSLTPPRAAEGRGGRLPGLGTGAGEAVPWLLRAWRSEQGGSQAQGRSLSNESKVRTADPPSASSCQRSRSWAGLPHEIVHLVGELLQSVVLTHSSSSSVTKMRPGDTRAGHLSLQWFVSAPGKNFWSRFPPEDIEVFLQQGSHPDGHPRASSILTPRIHRNKLSKVIFLQTHAANTVTLPSNTIAQNGKEVRGARFSHLSEP